MRRKQPDIPVASLTEAAFFSALTVLFCILGSYIPLLGAVINLVVPVPIIILTMRNGLKVGIIATLVSGILVGFLMGPFQIVVVILGFGFLGIALGSALKEGFSPGKVMITGSLVSLISKVLIIVVLLWLFNTPILDIPSQILSEENITRIEERSRSWGLSEEEIAKTVQMSKNLIEMLTLLFPAILIMASVLDTFINLNVTRAICKKLGQPIPGLPPFHEWKFPWYLVWIYLIGMVLAKFGPYLGIDFLSVLGFNIYYIIVYAFMIQGVAVAYSYLKEFKLHPALKWLIIIFVLFLPQAGIVLHWVGLLDILFDFRRFLDKKTTGGDIT